MSRLSPLVLSVLVAACASRPAAIVPQPLPAPAAAFDLSGDWVMGEGLSPPEPVVTVQRPCGSTVTHWRMYQDNEKLGAVLILGAALQGVPHELPVRETAWGSVEGEVLELESLVGVSAPKTTPWTLRYQSRPRRLLGTRDGVPVWFAPLVVVEPSDCRDSLTTPVPFSIEGSWMVGSGSPEPGASVLLEHRECAHHPARWTLHQRGELVEAWTVPESFDQGIATRNPVPVRKSPQSSGRLSGHELTLEGESRYRLRYDPESGHLRGTRDGVAVWAVKRSFVPPGPCLGIP